ncbi:MAG: hypothetical protein ACK51N_04510 [bacterium]
MIDGLPMYSSPDPLISDAETSRKSSLSSIPPLELFAGSCVNTQRNEQLLFHEPGDAIGSTNRPFALVPVSVSRVQAVCPEDCMLKSPPRMKFAPAGRPPVSFLSRTASGVRRS